MVNSWERKRIFGTHVVETCVVDAHPKLPVGLRDDHGIGQPPGVVDLPYEAGIEQPFAAQWTASGASARPV
jgi:hypothetical protein